MHTTNQPCDFCQTPTLEWVYTPIGSARGMEVMLCSRCGLIQSISTRAYASRPPPSMSADADRASIRYTKDIILDEHAALIEAELDFSRFGRVLDVGSNRGAFVRWVLARPRFVPVAITGIESDASVVDDYAEADGVTVHRTRFEEVSLPPEAFDFAHCTHTLEHARSAREMLCGMHDALVTGGILFLVVPDTLTIHPDMVEEIFIDPHTFHFNRPVLSRFAEACGFAIRYEATSEAGEIQLILEKTGEGPSDFGNYPRGLAEANRQKVASYAALMRRNRGALRAAAATLNELGTERLVIWGAGRLLDALVRIGDLNTSRVDLLVDKYLYKYMPDRYGIPLRSTAVLDEDPEQEGVFFVASRDYAAEITEEARRFPNMRVVTYNDVMPGD